MSKFVPLKRRGNIMMVNLDNVAYMQVIKFHLPPPVTHKPDSSKSNLTDFWRVEVKLTHDSIPATSRSFDSECEAFNHMQMLLI